MNRYKVTMTTSNYFAAGQGIRLSVDQQLPAIRSEREHAGKNHDELEAVVALRHHSKQFPSELKITVGKNDPKSHCQLAHQIVLPAEERPALS